jgi:hypothetical protein
MKNNPRNSGLRIYAVVIAVWLTASHEAANAAAPGQGPIGEMVGRLMTRHHDGK